MPQHDLLSHLRVALLVLFLQLHDFYVSRPRHGSSQLQTGQSRHQELAVLVSCHCTRSLLCRRAPYWHSALHSAWSACRPSFVLGTCTSCILRAPQSGSYLVVSVYCRAAWASISYCMKFTSHVWPFRAGACARCYLLIHCNVANLASARVLSCRTRSALPSRARRC